MSGPSELFLDGFETRRVGANGITVNVALGGHGPPVLLLHGYPQTHMIWQRVAALLRDRFTLVCPDLRGYGDSEKPPSSPDHGPYSKRVMAQDQLEVMQQLGYERFAVVGHDRGARVARRLALDRPEAVAALALLDIVPTATIYRELDRERATTVWRYFFLVQPFDLPERLIAADPGFYLRWTFEEWAGDRRALAPAALAEYERCFDETTIHMSCEDYRAGATIDLSDDAADAVRKIACPVLVLWSADGLGASYDVLDIWRQEADDVRGQPLECGHFLPEEAPEEAASLLRGFLSDVLLPA
jgi:haloacetate dehalogenase